MPGLLRRFLQANGGWESPQALRAASQKAIDQAFVKDPDSKVEKLLQKANAEVVRFVRFEVGEGIEKEEDDFAAEVAAQLAT